MTKSATPIEELRNLGPKTTSWLRVIGVEDDHALAELGAAETWVRLREAGFRPSRVALWALQGALLDLNWQELSEGMKEQLLTEAERLQSS